MEEAEWIAKMQQHDESAFEVIYEKYHQQAYRTAYFVTGTSSTAEDVVQEAFVQCFLQIQKLQDITCFRSWFYKILIRLAWKATKTAQKAVPVEDVWIFCRHSDMPDTAEVILQKEEQSLLWQAVNHLPQKQKTVVILYYYNEMSIAEIAKVMSCMEGTIKSRLHFARKKLYQILYQNNSVDRKVCGSRHEKA